MCIISVQLVYDEASVCNILSFPFTSLFIALTLKANNTPTTFLMFKASMVGDYHLSSSFLIMEGVNKRA